MRVVVLLNPLCGHGHVAVQGGILRALADKTQGLAPLVISGGAALPSFLLPPGVDVLQLPALVPTVGLFSELAPRLANVSRTELRKLRVRVVEAALRAFRPKILVIEHFPFGRLGFAKELLEVIERARAAVPGLVCVSSVAVLGGQSPGRETLSLDLASRLFERVLVHTDPRHERLDDDVPGASARLGSRLLHTGYVVPRPVPSDAEARAATRRAEGIGESERWLVAHGGGGRDGAALLRQAAAASECLGRDGRWRVSLVAGSAMPDDELAALRARVGGVGRVALEREAPQLHRWVAAADVTLSMAGYGTVAELLASGTPALLAPRAGEEQGRRAARLERLGLAALWPADGAPSSQAALVEETARGPRPRGASVLALDGAERSADALLELAGLGARAGAAQVLS